MNVNHTTPSRVFGRSPAPPFRHLAVLLILCLAAAPAAPAAAQSIANGNFEGGFQGDGVANDWTGTKQSSYTSASFLDGTDYYTNGSHSQKFNMPTPPSSNADLVITQKVNAAVSGVYTVGLDFRTTMPNENYSGEHMNVHLGLDPYGGSNIHSVNVEWYELSNNRNQWLSASHQVTAQSYLITVYIRVRRKFDHGNNGAAWVDNVTISGPTPDPTPSPTPTTTPTPTIPPPTGPEKVTNGAFESGFSSGVANNWTSWSSAGTGYWKRSTLVGKAGGGNYAPDTGWYEEMVAMQPKTILLGNGYGGADDFAEEAGLEDTIIVGRHVLSDNQVQQIYTGDYQAVAEWLADHYELEAGYHPRIDAWCGQNEPDWQNPSNWARTIAFADYFTDIMHARGLKSVVLNLAVGNPGDIDLILDCKDLFAKADYLGYHTYGGPADQLMVNRVNHNDPYDYALRARIYQQMYEQRGWRFPPVIYTEGTTYGGWHGDPNTSAADVRDDLISFIGYMNEDRWVTGLTIFDVGGNGAWEDWNIIGHGIAFPVGQANNADPADKTSGLYSQQFGVGTLHCLDNVCDHDGVFTGGLVQQVTGLTSGQMYRLGFDFKWEYANGAPAVEFRCGVDWTGQTGNPAAGTINWSADLIDLHDLPHEIFKYHYELHQAQSTTASIWFKGHQNVSDVSYRINLDTVSFQAVDAGTPMPTNTPGPTNTPTQTPTPSPTPACTPTTVIDTFSSTTSFDANWTAYGTSPSRYIKNEWWCSETSQLVEIQSSNGGYYRQFIQGAPGGEFTVTVNRVRGRNTRYIRVDANGGTNPGTYTHSWTNSGGDWVCETPSVLSGTIGTSGVITVFLGTTYNGQYRSLTVDFDCPAGPTATPTPTNTPTNTPTPTPTATPTATPTNTPTPTPTPTPSGPIASENFQSMPSWSSTYNAGWGGSATWSIESGGQSGNALQASRSNDGSSSRAQVYTVPQNTNLTISIYMRSSSGTGYWAECGYKLGSNTAENFDQSAGTWTLIKKFDSFGGQNGNSNTWTQYTANVNTGSNTQITIGYKLGRSGGSAPNVQWDTLVIDD